MTNGNQRDELDVRVPVTWRLQQTSKRNVSPPPRTLAFITMEHNISFNKILFIITIITYPPHSHTHKQYLRYKIEFIIFNKNLYEG